MVGEDVRCFVGGGGGGHVYYWVFFVFFLMLFNYYFWWGGGRRGIGEEREVNCSYLYVYIYLFFNDFPCIRTVSVTQVYTLCMCVAGPPWGAGIAQWLEHQT